MALSYFTNKKQSTCVITFAGTLAGVDAGLLEACLSDTLSASTKYVILNFGGLTAIEQSMTRPFALFQSSLRSQSKIFICNIQAPVLKVLNASGVVRDGEVQISLFSCLQMILQLEKERVADEEP